MMGNNDSVQSVVIDPSMAKGKVTPQQWQSLQGSAGVDALHDERRSI